eukprot:12988819-Alexandrium_andersonii.AAC.1
MLTSLIPCVTRRRRASHKTVQHTTPHGAARGSAPVPTSIAQLHCAEFGGAERDRMHAVCPVSCSLAS